VAYLMEGLVTAQGCTIPRAPSSRGDYILYDGANIPVSSLWYLLHVSLLAPIILRWPF